MIRAFKHKGLERFFLQGSKAGIAAQHGDRLRLILGRLQAAACAQDINLPGLHLHQLSGDRQHVVRAGQRQLAGYLYLRWARCRSSGL